MNTQHPIYQSEAKNLLFLFVYVAICAWLTHEALKRKKRTRHKRPEKVLIFGRDSTGLNLVRINERIEYILYSHETSDAKNAFNYCA